MYLSLPGGFHFEMKSDGASGKKSLRSLLYRYVPRELLERPKQGFAIPVDEWLRGPLRDWAEDLLSLDRLNRDGLLNPAPVRRMWSSHLQGRPTPDAALWSILDAASLASGE